MSGMEPRLQRQFRIAGILIILGLMTEALSLIRIHALSFLAFMFIGGALFIAGFVVYLYSLVAPVSAENGEVKNR